MRFHVNLASDPFRNDRPVYAGAIAVGLVLLGTLGLLVYLAVREREQVGETRDLVAGLERQLDLMAREEARLQGVLRRPENAEVLERSVFLNGLILPKAISWTRLFDDLEGVTPPTVRLISVRPQVSVPSGVALDMVVGAQSGDPVGQLLTKLEGSPVFGAPFVSSILPPSESEPLYRYRITVNYAQKL